MKRKNILFRTHIIAVLFLLFLSPVFAQNSYFIGLDSLESFGIESGSDVLNVSTSWTFEAWINVHSYYPGNDECIMDRRTVFSFHLISKGTGGDYAIKFVAKDSSDITNIAILRSDGGGDTETQMDFNTWYHVAATFDGDTARLYINSTETDTDTDTDWNLSTLWMAMSIGHKTTLNGSDIRFLTNTDIDEIRISNVARAIGDMQTTTNSNPYSVDTNTCILMHLDDQAVPPTYICGLGVTPIPDPFSNNITLDDYEFPNGLPLAAGILANIKVFLEGPYNGSTMSTTLRDNGHLPLSQPYNTTPWNYTGTESVVSIPAGMVDWVLLELRSDLTTVVARRAAFLKSDGTIVDTDGSSPVTFTGLSDGFYYIVIRHRNHLAIMTESAILLNSGSALYDFRTAQSQAYGSNAMKDLGNGVFGMVAGDANTDGFITSTDFNVFNPKFRSAASGYESADWNLDRFVTSTDFNYFNPNFKSAKQSFVP